MADVLPRLQEALGSRYRIVRELGEGGMATVFLAEDLKHGRNVALKVLKPELAAAVGAERFLAEIKTTANLQHPHILPLFDSGEADGFVFYVMPYVAGESLRDRLDREKQLPVDEAVRIASDVAEALAYAHRESVIHRDIKPANVLLSEGRPLVSDFGIALALGAARDGRLTETGLSLGTPHYMSPEQATGAAHVGPAADIFALGCVLYEMLAGEPPYTGSTPQAVIGKIVATPLTPVTAHRKTVPAHIAAVLSTALEKVPADRFTSAAAMAEKLGDPSYRAVAERDGSATGTVRAWRGVAAVLALLAAGLAGTLAFALGSTDDGPVARFVIDLHPDEPFPPPGGVELDISADGSRLVYVGPGPRGGTQLWQRSLDELLPTPIPGTEGARDPVLAPDGLTIAFARDGIRTVPVEGGSPSLLTPTGAQPEWAPDGTTYFVEANAIHRVSSTGGQPTQITPRLPAGGPRFLDALPEGAGLLATLVADNLEDQRIAVLGPEGGQPREILTGLMARYAPSGHIVYTTSDGTLMAAPFDPERLEVTGESVPVQEGVRVAYLAASQFALSASGSLVYKSRASALREIVWVDRTGTATAIDPTWTDMFGSVSLSPDETRVAVDIEGGDVWVRSLDRGGAVRLTFEGNLNYRPVWNPDGDSITFVSNRDGAEDLWIRSADGSGTAAPLLPRDRGVSQADWSSDGGWLVYRTSVWESGAGDILATRPGRDDPDIELVATRFAETSPALSPDGRWLAYVSNESGTGEVYVAPFPDAGSRKWSISNGGGRYPVWARSGDELFYRDRVGDVVAVDVQREPVFGVGESRVLFPEQALGRGGAFGAWDVAPDGRRFLMMRLAEDANPTSVVLVQNFARELERLVGG